MKIKQKDFSRWYIIANTRFWAKQSICKVWSFYIQPFRRHIYKKVHYCIVDFDLRSRTRNVAQYPLHHMTFASAKFEAAMSNGLGGNAFTRNIWYESQGHMNHCPLHQFMWPMYLQSLNLLGPMVKEMHYQENTLFELDPKVKGVKVTWNVAQYPRHHVTYAPTEFEVTTLKGSGGEAFTRKFYIWSLTLTFGWRSHEMLPSSLYIIWPIQLQSLKLLRLTIQEEIHLQENTLFDLWPWGQGHTKCCPVPSTSCDLFSYKVWSCYVKRFRRCIYKKI